MLGISFCVCEKERETVSEREREREIVGGVFVCVCVRASVSVWILYYSLDTRSWHFSESLTVTQKPDLCLFIEKKDLQYIKQKNEKNQTALRDAWFAPGLRWTSLESFSSLI